ncbi:hypothetical protein [Sorangium sp. So ce1024]|uniref:hypothetical protein n=1 Tax=Sorangium sp. So ce1024 TaxID=3133327 RepID=UPI003F1009C5
MSRHRGRPARRPQPRLGPSPELTPLRALLWSSGAEVQWWLARAWDVGAIVAMFLRAAQLIAGAVG